MNLIWSIKAVHHIWQEIANFFVLFWSSLKQSDWSFKRNSEFIVRFGEQLFNIFIKEKHFRSYFSISQNYDFFVVAAATMKNKFCSDEVLVSPKDEKHNFSKKKDSCHSFTKLRFFCRKPPTYILKSKINLPTTFVRPKSP